MFLVSFGLLFVGVFVALWGSKHEYKSRWTRVLSLGFIALAGLNIMVRAEVSVVDKLAAGLWVLVIWSSVYADIREANRSRRVVIDRF